MTNRSNPMPSDGTGAAVALGRMSSQTPETAQTAGDANRLVPPHQMPGPRGTAIIDPTQVLDGQSCDLTARTKASYAERKKAFGIP